MRDNSFAKIKLKNVGFVDSFNLSVSCAIISSYLLANKDFEKVGFDEEEKQQIMAYWLIQKTRHSNKILKNKGIIIEDL